jgi:hypothetical protein
VAARRGMRMKSSSLTGSKRAPVALSSSARRDLEHFAPLRALRRPSQPKQHWDFHQPERRLTCHRSGRYCSGQKKRCLKIPKQITNYANIVPSHYTVDLAVSYDMGDQPENEYLRNISLQLVVNNVTNKRPPFAYKASTSGSGGSAFWGLVDSPIQRQISLTITKTW